MAAPLRLAHASPHPPSAREPMRVVLVDPHAAMRRSLRALLEDAHMQVVVEADAVASAVAQIREHDPHALVLDVSFQPGAAVRSMRWLRESMPAIPIVAVTMHDDQAFARALLLAGAREVVLKDAADPALVRAIHAL